MVFGDLEIIPEEGVVRLAGTDVHLTKIEFRLLVELATNLGRVLSREVLLERVWGYGYFGDGCRRRPHPSPADQDRARPRQPPLCRHHPGSTSSILIRHDSAAVESTGASSPHHRTLQARGLLHVIIALSTLTLARQTLSRTVRSELLSVAVRNAQRVENGLGAETEIEDVGVLLDNLTITEGSFPCFRSVMPPERSIRPSMLTLPSSPRELVEAAMRAECVRVNGRP